jgi:DNA-binding beta-propeller fold protein YncE
MFALCRASHGSAVQQLLRALCAIADVRSGVGAHSKSAAALCVSAALGDAGRRLSAMGGRAGMPRSLGSVLGCWVVRFLGGFRGKESRVIPTPMIHYTCMGIAISRDGSTLLVSDRHVGSQCVHTFHATTGAYLRAVGSAGTGPLQFCKPCQIWVAPDDHVFVVEYGNHRVQELTPQLDFHGFIGAGQLRNPAGVCADGEIVAVSEYVSCRISVFRRGDGALLRRFGSFGHGDGQLQRPQGLCIIIKTGHIAVADDLNGRISVFRVDGAFVRHVGAGQLGRPSGVASCSASGDGQLVAVADAGGFGQLVVFGAGNEVLHAVRGVHFSGVAIHGDTIYAQRYCGECVVFN